MDNKIKESYEWAIENAVSMIEYYKQVITEAEEQIKQNEWMNSKDKLELQGRLYREVAVQCNYEDWSIAKKENKERRTPFFLEVVNNHDKTRASAGLTIEQAKQLRDYLNHKLEYLES